MIILAILFPPLYFLLNKKIGMCVLTGAMFIVAMFLAITIVLLPGSLILWVIAMIAAVRDNRRKALEAHAEMFTNKLAEKLRPEQTPPALPRQ
jgi:uncharacterized membrane protein